MGGSVQRRVVGGGTKGVLRIIDLDETATEARLTGHYRDFSGEQKPPRSALPDICLRTARKQDVTLWVATVTTSVAKGAVTIDDLVESLGPPSRVDFPEEDGNEYIVSYLVNPDEYLVIQQTPTAITKDCPQLEFSVSWPKVTKIAEKRWQSYLQRSKRDRMGH
jgi:hypothetical protein